ncbi:MAG: UDP-N-acetylglucosamine--N-acetylmuramyl-(pentapeptide) pyrophosphoryl-undecaprenol N-acetylglucosamine transferase, partial [Clostridia bacterium]|nr:UDP-N-acetylglucosamine--N-acetylmuramyl-(pentapeptide) pyrophosphoryl-undecaprenol N-acetylglucosamine transferase [Clostridia bacterium]
EFQVIHLCGKEHLDQTLAQTKGYAQFEYIKEELKDLFALSDIVISRAGANAICELLSLKKPSLLIPLPAKSSRGDQILNANSFKKQGFSMVLDEEKITDELLLDMIHTLYKDRLNYIKAMEQCGQTDSTNKIITIIKELCNL